MKKIKQFFKLEKELHDYFGYKEDWVVFPMQDYTEVWWSVTDENYEKEYEVLSDGQKICLSYEHNFFFTNDKESHITLIDYNWQPFKAGVADKCYHYEIYHQRFLKTPIFRGEDYSMILVDTHTDGNKYMVILDNKKELSRKIIKNIHRKAKIENLK